MIMIKYLLSIHSHKICDVVVPKYISSNCMKEFGIFITKVCPSDVCPDSPVDSLSLQQLVCMFDEQFPEKKFHPS